MRVSTPAKTLTPPFQVTGGSSPLAQTLLPPLPLSRRQTGPRLFHTRTSAYAPRRDHSALYSKYYDKILKPDGAPPPSSKHANQPEKTNTMLKQDKELLEKLLDREGGAAGVATVDGSYEEGLGKETKKNMFRLI